MLIPRSHLVARPDPERRFRLLEQVRRRARERRYSERTIGAYVHWIRQFVIHCGRKHPRELGAEQVRDFLSFLAVERRVAASTQNQALAALNFLYVVVLQSPFERLEGVTPARPQRRAPTSLATSIIDACASGHRNVSMAARDLADLMRQYAPRHSDFLPPLEDFIPAAQEVLRLYVDGVANSDITPPPV